MTGQRQVSVVCAPPNGYNPGMTSVDLAFSPIAAHLDCDVTYWRLWDQAEWSSPPGGSSFVDVDHVHDLGSDLTYRLARDRISEVMDADAIVFWGDFMHMAVYLRQTADVISRRIGAASFETAYDAAARLYLMRGADSATLDRVITYGSTLSFNTAADYAADYGAELSRLVGGARRTWFRDPYSATVAQTARNDDLTCKAPDAAFLLPGTARTSQGTLGVFVGRSNFQPEAIGAFGRQLAEQLDLLPRWVPWGIEPGFWPMEHRRRFRAAWPGLEHGTAHPSRSQMAQTLWRAALDRDTAQQQPPIAQLFELIASCEVIVTDTYHLAVNAWRLGTPTVCLTDGDHREWNVNAGEPRNFRDKRYDLYSQLDALPLLVDGRRLRPLRDRTAIPVVETLREGVVAKTATSRARHMAESARTSLLKELEGILYG